MREKFGHPAILQWILRTLFCGKKPMALLYPRQLDPIPSTVFAVAATVVCAPIFFIAMIDRLTDFYLTALCLSS